jgi:hypothetical protein
MSRSVETHRASVFVGLREGYSSCVHSLDEVIDLACGYCDRVGLCVTVTPTTFCYTNGREPGAILGLIHYPRFPRDDPAAYLREHAMALGQMALEAFRQLRVTVMLEDVSILLERPDKSTEVG